MGLHTRFLILACLALACGGCSLGEGLSDNGAPVGVTVAPPSYYTAYYSTQKARYLGEKYGRHLDQLMEQVVDSPVGRLEFANNIVSVSMGFFTHSASQAPDARYLEVLLGMPDILQESTDLRAKVERLFSQYGRELLAILANDMEIYNDKEVAGYGLNFSWRSIAQTPAGPHMTLEGAVVYVPKEEARRLVTQQIEPEEILGKAVIFARQGEHPAKLVRHPPSTPSPEVRAPTHQQTAATSPQVLTSVIKTDVEEKKVEPPVAPSAPLAKAQHSEAEAPTHQETAATSPQVPTSEIETEEEEEKADPPAAPSAPLAKAQHSEVEAPTQPETAATSPQAPTSMIKTEVEEKKANPLQEGQGESAKAKGAGSTQARQDGLPLQEGQGERAKAKGEVATQARQDSLRLKEQAPAPLLEAQQPPQVMRGYLIQLSFLEGTEAEHWSDHFSGEGYSTAMSMLEEGRFVRLRIGSFFSVVEATNFLEELQAQGLQGLVLQVPD